MTGGLDLAQPGQAVPEAAFAEGDRVRVRGDGVHQRAQVGRAGTVIEVHEVKHKQNFIGHTFRVKFAGGDTDTFSPRELEALAPLPYSD